MSKNWRWFLPAYPLLAVHALTYVIFLLVTFTRPTDWRWHEGVLTCVSGKGRLPFNAGGQGWSWIVGFANERQRQRAELRVHEFEHVGQEFACSILGLILLIASLAFGWGWIGLILALIGASTFHLVWLGTWLYSRITRRGWGFENSFTWNGNKNPADNFRAYRSVVWETNAYKTEAEFKDGRHSDAWGASSP